jgi:hypothetical protein
MKRQQPSARCARCERTVALTANAAAAARAIGHTGAVAPAALRPHKCNHGNWCDECREKH